jgi:hypothetical protein
MWKEVLIEDVGRVARSNEAILEIVFRGIFLLDMKALKKTMHVFETIVPIS